MFLKDRNGDCDRFSVAAIRGRCAHRSACYWVFAVGPGLGIEIFADDDRKSRASGLANHRVVNEARSAERDRVKIGAPCVESRGVVRDDLPIQTSRAKGDPTKIGWAGRPRH